MLKFCSIYKEVFDKYRSLYKEILTNIYPACGGNGFTERNLSVNFSKAYESVTKDKGQQAYTWFEFPFAGSNHVDAVIVNTTTKEIFIIEAKRYNHPKKKKERICRDIERMPEFISSLSENEHIKNAATYQYYGIILADVWTENDVKKDILEYYKKERINKNLLRELLDNKDYSLNCVSDDIYCDIKSFEDVDKEAIRVEYNLVSMWWTIS